MPACGFLLGLLPSDAMSELLRTCVSCTLGGVAPACRLWHVPEPPHAAPPAPQHAAGWRPAALPADPERCTAAPACCTPGPPPALPAAAPVSAHTISDAGVCAAAKHSISQYAHIMHKPTLWSVMQPVVCDAASAAAIGMQHDCACQAYAASHLDSCKGQMGGWQLLDLPAEGVDPQHWLEWLPGQLLQEQHSSRLRTTCLC